MGEVIFVKDFNMTQPAPVIKELTVNEKLTQSPLHIAEDSLCLVRKRLAKMLGDTTGKTLLMPFASDLDPSWIMEADIGWFNSSFLGYPVLHSVVRDYPREFVQIVDGTIVESDEAHRKIVDGFNTLYVKALKNKGAGYPKGTLSEDQFLRLGSLFFIMLKTSNMTEGVLFNEMGLVDLKWCGEPRVVNVNTKQIQAYSERLQGKFFANCDWEQFFFRCFRENLPECVWLINLTMADFGAESTSEITLEDLVKIFNFIPMFSRRGHDYCIVLQYTEENIEILKYVYYFEEVEKGLYHSPEGMTLDTRSLGRRYMSITPRYS